MCACDSIDQVLMMGTNRMMSSRFYGGDEVVITVCTCIFHVSQTRIVLCVLSPLIVPGISVAFCSLTRVKRVEAPPWNPSTWQRWLEVFHANSVFSIFLSIWMHTKLFGPSPGSPNIE